ncbi:MAG: hypothetical protein ABIV51_01950 [Saprospiraceae bacterium]
MPKYFLIIASILAIGLVFCQQKDEQKGELRDLSEQAIPIERLQYLLDSCTAIEYIFYDPSRNISIEKRIVVDQHINFISKNAQALDAACIPIAHVMFRVKKLIPIEAELYYSKDCQYWLITDRKRKQYIQKINPAGIEFIQQIQAQKIKLSKSKIH